MKKFIPKRVFIEEGALEYPLARKLDKDFKKQAIPVEYIESHNRLNPKEQMTPTKLFNWTKETLAVGVKKTLRFKSCKPSADYRVVTNTSCPGKCEYCYLAKNLGSASYLRIYVNIDEILEAVQKHIKKGEGNIVSFEASSSSDPVGVEHLTGNLRRLIDFFGKEEKGRLRVVTKFPFVDNLLDIDHNDHTKFRFSINSSYVIKSFEHLTGSLDERISAANKIQKSGYPLGFIIAPLMVYEGWREDYKDMLVKLHKELASSEDDRLTFELIMHRFTTRSKNLIESRFPNSKLKLDKERYSHKGFGKYVYPPDEAEEMKNFMEDNIKELFPKSSIEYFI